MVIGSTNSRSTWDRSRRGEVRCLACRNVGDRLLTVLTILFVLLLFVIAWLHAAGIVLSQDVGLAVAFVVIVTVLFAYGFRLPSS